MKFRIVELAAKAHVMKAAQLWHKLAGDERGQATAEYGIMMWFVAFAGAATLVVFFFAFEEAIIGYYEDIVNIVCLPIP